MNAISDQHSIEFEFKELQPSIGGVRLDIYISGVAELAADPGYQFYVKSIRLDGTTPDKFARPTLFGGRPRKAAITIINKPAKGDTSLEAQIFRWLESAIYDDELALRAWASEFEEAA
ncbi:hypothetical protein [Aquamicrobium defluvii]|uniref:Uncharacterized protein n=1 Tax=Aquamicrobium defluvii TaxID=69279 RepID=A0A4V3DJE6_9HYPH|nr:hypothetical protein [Aquamicrobium defluvii]TDR27766.1 hypothetical protein DES43_1663 [Aquamicrobium defluvii]